MMKKLMLLMLLVTASLCHAQFEEVIWGFSNGPKHLVTGVRQLDLEYFLNKKNSITLGLGHKNHIYNLEVWNLNSDIDYIDGERVEEKTINGFKGEIMHKHYFPLNPKVEDKYHYRNYYNLFLIHGIGYQYQEHEFDVAVWKENSSGELAFHEGTIYDYITRGWYTLALGIQMLTQDQRFAIEFFVGARYQKAWVDASPDSQVNYESTTLDYDGAVFPTSIDYGYSGFVPEVNIKIGVYFLRKEKE